MERRTLLRAGMATGASVLLAGCTSGDPVSTGDGPPVQPSSSGASGSASGSASARPGRDGWKALDGSLEGRVLRHGERYDEARLLYNPRFAGIHPAAVVQPATAEDVAETIRFATRHGLALRPRSGGHSYVGDSTVEGGIQLDLSRMAAVRAQGSSVHVQPGGRLFDVHLALEEHGRTLPSGTCPTVGVAGLTLGGGIGAESRTHGLTCDALEALTVVTADGRVREVSAEHEPDLFWASRGGGGGSFGVVTDLRFTTFEATAMDFFQVRFASPDAAAVIDGWRRRVAEMPRNAWSNVHLDIEDGALSVHVLGLSLAGDAAGEAAALVASVGREPLGTDVFQRSHADGVKLLAGCAALSDAECAPAPDGSLVAESFVAGGDILGPGLDAAAARIVGFLRSQVHQLGKASLVLDPLGGRVADTAPGASAFRWRRATGVAQWYVSLGRGSVSAARVRRGYRFVHEGHRVMGDASVGGYVNYPEPGRPVRDYFGRNDGRLRSIKAAVDPDGFFRAGSTVRGPGTH